MKKELTPEEKERRYTRTFRILWILAVVFALFAAVFLTSSLIGNTNKAIFFDQQTISLREKIRKEGKKTTQSSSLVMAFREGSYYRLDLGYQTYVQVAESSASGDYMEFGSVKQKGDYTYSGGFMIDLFSSSSQERLVFDITVLDKDGNYLKGDDGNPYNCLLEYSYHLQDGTYTSRPIPLNNWYVHFSQEFLNTVEVQAGEMLDPFMTDLRQKASSILGINDLDAFLIHNCVVLEHLGWLVIPGGIFGVVSLAISGMLGVIVFALFFVRFYRNKVASYEGNLPPPQPEPKEELPELEKGLDTKVAGLAKKIKMTPFIPEFAIRAIGLGVILLYAVFMGLAKISDSRGWISSDLFFTPGAQFFEAFSSLGSLILTLAVVTIVAETRRHLYRNSVFFFSLGVGYYVLSTALLFYLDMGLNDTELAEGIIALLQFALPGNIPMGLGIFCFVGFFLFLDPDERFVRRGVFRALAAIPLVIAVASIILSALWKLDIFSPPYFLSNLLFIRDPAFLVVGLAYELLIFGLRSKYRKYYGDNADKMEALPEVQMVKNIALCGLIVFFTIVFYCIPSNLRLPLGFTSIWTFYPIAIPIFLFQKPAAANRDERWDTLYYILVIGFTFLPQLFSAISQLFAGLGI